MSSRKSLEVWFCVNKSRFIGLYMDQPKRNNDTGKWDAKCPFINSNIYEQISKLVEKTKYSWENEPECITIGFD